KLPKTDSIQELADLCESHELTDFEQEPEAVAHPVVVRGSAVSSATTEGHFAALDPEVLAAQCEFRTTRRSGPGGQNRNKVETAVILTHRKTGVSATASERRTQGENRRAALKR